MGKEDFIFFWGGIYSQWYRSDFTINGITYNCCEQYMMALKALLFHDLEAYDKIMSSYDPSYQKAIGRTVKGFHKGTWESVCRDIVYNANYAKFTQSPDLMHELMLTNEIEIVEASPEDAIWGIGLHGDNPLAWDKATWKGTNWLGIAIMQVRETIKNKLASGKSL